MERYIGLDVHMQSTTVAVVGASGKRIRRLVVETTGQGVLEAIKGVAGQRRVCLEEGTQSEWLAELLEPHVEELVVFVPEKSRGPKSDEADAWAMAEKLRVGALRKCVFKPAGAMLGLRAAVRRHGMVLGDVVRVKNRLRGLYRSRGLYQGGGAMFRPSKRQAWERKLPDPLGKTAALLGTELDALEQLRGEAESSLVEEAGRHAAVRRLMTAPAIGVVRAAQIVATVVTPYRFRTKRQFWSYCGLGIVTRSSADWVRSPGGKFVRMRTFQARGLNGNRNGLLKLVFKCAAHQICRQMTSDPLHQHFVRLVDAGTKRNLATLTIARRLAATVLAMWKHQEDYDPARHTPSAR
jgi:transposase